MDILGVIPLVILSALCVGMFYMAYLPAIEDSLARDAREKERRTANRPQEPTSTPPA